MPDLRRQVQAVSHRFDEGEHAMTDDELRALAEAALEDERMVLPPAPGAKTTSFGAGLGREFRREAAEQRAAKAITREPELARAVLRLLDEVDTLTPLAAVAEVSLASDDHARSKLERIAELSSRYSSGDDGWSYSGDGAAWAMQEIGKILDEHPEITKPVSGHSKP
jgi:hypothetical protein